MTQLRPIKACHSCSRSYTVEEWQGLTSARFLWPIDTRVCVCGVELKVDLQGLETIDQALPVDRESFRAFVRSIHEKNTPPNPQPSLEQPPPEQPPPEQRPPEQPSDARVYFRPEGVTLLYLHVPLLPTAHVVPPRENAQHRAERFRGILAGAQGLLNTLVEALETAEGGGRPRP